MSLKKGETGKIIRVAAGFDMSNNTELSLIFTKPDSDSTIVTKTTSDGVVLKNVDVSDSTLGDLTANEYVEYPTESGFLSDSGEWEVYLKYENTNETPNHVYIGACSKFTVSDVTC